MKCSQSSATQPRYNVIKRQFWTVTIFRLSHYLLDCWVLHCTLRWTPSSSLLSVYWRLISHSSSVPSSVSSLRTVIVNVTNGWCSSISSFWLVIGALLARSHICECHTLITTLERKEKFSEISTTLDTVFSFSEEDSISFFCFFIFPGHHLAAL